MDSLKCQTATATPAEPGDLPCWFRGAIACTQLTRWRRRPTGFRARADYDRARQPLSLGHNYRAVLPGLPMRYTEYPESKGLGHPVSLRIQAQVKHRQPSRRIPPTRVRPITISCWGSPAPGIDWEYAWNSVRQRVDFRCGFMRQTPTRKSRDGDVCKRSGLLTRHAAAEVLALSDELHVFGDDLRDNVVVRGVGCEAAEALIGLFVRPEFAS